MRATKGYVAGVGTTSALVGAIGCAFAILSAIVAVHGWPLTLNLPGASTVDGNGASAEMASPPLDVFPGATAATAADTRRVGGGPGGDGAVGRVVPAGPVASAFGPATGDRLPRSAGPVDIAMPASAPAVGAPDSASSSSSGPSSTPSSGAGSGSTTQSPSTPDTGGSTTLGGTVTQVTSSAGTAVTQTGQQLGAVVQGTTDQVGDAVGQVSPAAGQAVTQTGQTAGGVASGTTGTVGGVVTGVGTTAGGLLGGLTGSR